MHSRCSGADNTHLDTPYLGRIEKIIVAVIVAVLIVSLFAYVESVQINELNTQIANLNNEINSLNSTIRLIRNANIVTGGYYNIAKTNQCVGIGCTFAWEYDIYVYYSNVGRDAATATNLTATVWGSSNPSITLCGLTAYLGTIPGQTEHYWESTCLTNSTMRGDSVSVNFDYLDSGY